MVELRSGNAVVSVFPDDGGRVGQIEVRGRGLLRGPEYAHLGWGYWGSYPLLPWSNRIPAGAFRFEGQDMRVPVSWEDGSALHGLGARSPWEVVSSGPTSVELNVRLTEGPYDVVGRQTFDLSPTHLEQRLSVTNVASHRVPAGLGIHPWFRAGVVRVPAGMKWPGDPLPEGAPVPVGPDEDLRTGIVAPVMDRCFTGLTGSTAEVPGLRVHWSGPDTNVVVYSGDPAWVCVEPVTMANDGFRLADEGVPGSGVIALDPGASLQVVYRFEFL